VDHEWQIRDVRDQLRRACVNGLVVDTTNQVPYVVCTTCHNQHQMNVYSAGKGLSAITGAATGTYATYFFVNSPYNPGASLDSDCCSFHHASSAVQCHFGVAMRLLASRTSPLRLLLLAEGRTYLSLKF